jgi:hypothetical protein
MACTRPIIGLPLRRHSWERTVSWTDAPTYTETDMWGRRYDSEQVLCRTEFVCRVCGEKRAGALCECDKARGDQCPVRLACLSTPAA